MPRANNWVDRRWISGNETARRFCCHPNSVAKVAAANHIRRRELPGTPVRYLALDVDRVVEKYLTPDDAAEPVAVAS